MVKDAHDDKGHDDRHSSNPWSGDPGLSAKPLLSIVGVLAIGGIFVFYVHTSFEALLFPSSPPSRPPPDMGEIPGDVPVVPQAPQAIYGVGTAIMGGIAFELGILSIVVAYGLLKGRRWAWRLTIILSVISIVLNAISIATGNIGGIVSIIISWIILYYLYRPRVKAYFSKKISPQEPTSRTQATSMARPTGVVIIAILNIISGIFTLLVGLVLVVLAAPL
jgi:hypothetical protein